MTLSQTQLQGLHKPVRSYKHYMRSQSLFSQQRRHADVAAEPCRNVPQQMIMKVRRLI